jgi:hypothetical protein
LPVLVATAHPEVPICIKRLVPKRDVLLRCRYSATSASRLVISDGVKGSELTVRGESRCTATLMGCARTKRFRARSRTRVSPGSSCTHRGSTPPAGRWLIGLPRGSTPAAGRGRREIRSCWGVSRLPFLPAGSTPCEWAELPRELSTVSHSGQADAQRGQGVLEARDIELSPARTPRHEIHRQRGAACDRFRGFCNARKAELGLRKSVWCSRRTLD